MSALTYLIGCLVSLTSVCGAIMLLAMGVEHGWGWLLVVACVTQVHVEVRKKGNAE